MKKKIIIGVDEAGRGPLAGSVFACASVVDENLYEKFKELGITDSKKLTEKVRFELYEFIKNSSVVYCWAKRDAKFIDESDILTATFEAMKEATLGVIKKLNASKDDFEIMVDGKLKIRNFEYDTTPIVKGDSKVLEISVASIIAKCEKDLESIEMDKKYPNYKFANHKGYGTKVHCEAIKKFGICEFHRKSFAPIKETFFDEEYHSLKEKILSCDEQELEQIKINLAFNSLDLSAEEIELLQKCIKKRKF